MYFVIYKMLLPQLGSIKGDKGRKGCVVKENIP